MSRNKEAITTNEIAWLEQVEKACGEDCRVADKNEENAIACCFKSMSSADAYGGTVYRWIGVLHQTAYDIVNDKQRLNVLKRDYIVNKMKTAMVKEQKEWKKQLQAKRKVKELTCEADAAPKQKKKRKKKKLVSN